MPDMGDMPHKQEDARVQVAILLVLLLGLSFALIHFNIVSCGFYSPLGCEVYYGIISGGKPKVLIVHGNEGMGNPDYLFEVLKSPKIQAQVVTRELDTVSLRFLQDYQLVIVEKADTMGIEDIRLFQEYVTRGGRLIWIGDAGTKAPDNQSDLNYFLIGTDRKAAGKKGYIGPWARRAGDKQVSLDYTLGVQFIGNYCRLKKCDSNGASGFFDFPNQSEKFSNGLTQGLEFYGDFALVKLNDSGYQKAFAYLNYGPDFITEPPKDYFWLSGGRQNLGKSFPMIVSSGVGGRVVYYAFPPESVVGENMPIDKATGKRLEYWGIIENMYYGMLYK